VAAIHRPGRCKAAPRGDDWWDLFAQFFFVCVGPRGRGILGSPKLTRWPPFGLQFCYKKCLSGRLAQVCSFAPG
jgi:hypothetical protein